MGTALRAVTHNLRSAASTVNKHAWTAFVAAHDADVVLLQSLNLASVAEGERLFGSMGYHMRFALGDPAPSRYSVGILSRRPFDDVDAPDNPQLAGIGSWLAARIGGIWFGTLYRRLRADEAEHDALKAVIGALPVGEPVIVAGDFNTIQVTSLDANQPTVFGCGPAERAFVAKLIADGFVDTFRSLHPETSGYTWWSRSSMFLETPNRGTRIDLQLARGLKPVTARVDEAWCAQVIDFGGGADHAPLIVEYAL